MQQAPLPQDAPTAQAVTEEAQEEAQQVLRDLENIDWLAILVTIILAWVAVTVIQWVIPWLVERLPPRFRHWLLPVAPILRIFVLAFAALRLLSQIIHPSTQNILTIAGAAAVAIGFAFKDYASSIVAGMVALYERPYRPGDWVNIGGDYGEVRSVGLRALRILRPDDTVVTIPHSRLWTNNIANANDGKREHLCIANFYVEPDHDPERARRVLYDVALTSAYTQLRRPISVLVFSQPWATHYQLRAYPVDGRNEFLFVTEMTMRGKKALAEADIAIAQLPPSLAAPIRGNVPISSYNRLY